MRRLRAKSAKRYDIAKNATKKAEAPTCRLHFPISASNVENQVRAAKTPSAASSHALEPAQQKSDANVSVNMQLGYRGDLLYFLEKCVR